MKQGEPLQRTQQPGRLNPLLLALILHNLHIQTPSHHHAKPRTPLPGSHRSPPSTPMPLPRSIGACAPELRYTTAPELADT